MPGASGGSVRGPAEADQRTTGRRAASARSAGAICGCGSVGRGARAGRAGLRLVRRLGLGRAGGGRRSGSRSNGRSSAACRRFAGRRAGLRRAAGAQCGRAWAGCGRRRGAAGVPPGVGADATRRAGRSASLCRARRRRADLAARGRGRRRANVLFVVLVVWASDIGAYLAGRLVGGPTPGARRFRRARPGRARPAACWRRWRLAGWPALARSCR